MDLGKLAAHVHRLKKHKANLNAELRDLNKELDIAENELLQEMQRQNLVKLATPDGAVYVTRQTVPHVQNWDEFYAHIRENNAFHLLERRPSKAAYREELEAGIMIPGVDPYSFDEIRTRKS